MNVDALIRYAIPSALLGLYTGYALWGLEAKMFKKWLKEQTK